MIQSKHFEYPCWDPWAFSDLVAAMKALMLTMDIFDSGGGSNEQLFSDPLFPVLHHLLPTPHSYYKYDLW